MIIHYFKEGLFMNVSADKFHALLEEVSAIRAKLDMYEKYENAREREFRELERDVYNLKNERGDHNRTLPIRLNHRQVSNEDTAGVAWLR
jgi:hypothetical protein